LNKFLRVLFVQIDCILCMLPRVRFGGGLIKQSFVRVDSVSSKWWSWFSVSLSHHADDLLWHGRSRSLWRSIWKVWVSIFFIGNFNLYLWVSILYIYVFLFLQLAQLRDSVFNFLLLIPSGQEPVFFARLSGTTTSCIVKASKLSNLLMDSIVVIRTLVSDGRWILLLIHLFFWGDLHQILTYLIRH
jgi:hypothetical protein